MPSNSLFLFTGDLNSSRGTLDLCPCGIPLLPSYLVWDQFSLAALVKRSYTFQGLYCYIPPWSFFELFPHLVEIWAQKLLEALSVSKFRMHDFFRAISAMVKKTSHLHLTIVIDMYTGPSRWLNNWKHWIFIHRAWIWSPVSTRQSTTAYGSTHRGTDTVFWPPLVPGIHLVYTLAKLTYLN